jgi:hypothetical protein
LELQLNDVHLVWLILVIILVLLALGVAALGSLSGGPRH